MLREIWLEVFNDLWGNKDGAHDEKKWAGLQAILDEIEKDIKTLFPEELAAKYFAKKQEAVITKSR